VSAHREHRCGSVALLGWTNVGKSTLLNRLVGAKLAAVGEAAQTTRHRITGVVQLAGRGQIAFIDTPGLHEPRFHMNRAMVDQALRAMKEVDLKLLMIDADRGPGPGDHQAATLLRRTGGERMLLLNKIDRIRPKSRLLPMMRLAAEEWDVTDVLPISAATGEGCEDLIERVLERLPAGPAMFPADFLTDQSEQSLAAEWIREELARVTRQELPHATAVVVEGWRERPDGLLQIDAGILVERDSQKRIIIGRQGELLGRAGTAARGELERALGRRVVLKLWVKTQHAWRNDAHVLRRLGLA
jgi:GTP-binding protein Era